MTTATAATNPTLADVAKLMDPDGKIDIVVEQMMKRSPLLKDATWVMGNLPTGHKFTSRTGLPSIGWRKFNEGINASKSRTQQITETCGMLEGRAEVDSALAELSGNPDAFRASEATAFLQAFTHEIETGAFYHSTEATPEKFQGLTPRLDVIAGPYPNQIIDSSIAASGADQTSMWFINWSPETVFMMYPKDSKAGLEHKDMGEEYVEDADGKKFLALRDHWTWKVGMCVKDSRYLVRLCNIDTSAIAATGKLLIQDMIKAAYALQDFSAGRTVIYCNRLVATYLHLQAQDSAANSTLKIEQIEGQPVTTFMGMPIRWTDALLNTEAIVT
ncbi:MAG: hypothetical protein Q8L48_16765 [Archangium sp.]|nr:hypothetical protein [Archangium sp.]